MLGAKHISNPRSVIKRRNGNPLFTDGFVFQAWTGMSTGPMPVFPSGVVLIPYASATGGIGASLEYDTKQDSWKEGPVPVVKAGKYAVVQGAMGK